MLPACFGWLVLLPRDTKRDLRVVFCGSGASWFFLLVWRYAGVYWGEFFFSAGNSAEV